MFLLVFSSVGLHLLSGFAKPKMHLQLHGGCYDCNLKLLFLHSQFVVYIQSPFLQSHWNQHKQRYTSTKPSSLYLVLAVLVCQCLWPLQDRGHMRSLVDVLDERNKWRYYDKLPCSAGIITWFKIFTRSWSLFSIFLQFLAAFQWLLSVSVFLQAVTTDVEWSKQSPRWSQRFS